MKKILTLAMLICLMTNVTAQNCNYEKNEVDPVTKKQLKITKGETLTGKISAKNNILVVKGIKQDVDVILLFGLTVQTSVELELTVKKGYKAFLIMEDGSNVEIAAFTDFKGTKFSQKSFGNLLYGIDAQYWVTNDKLPLLYDKQVKTVRIEMDINGNKQYKDTEINEKSKTEISKVLKCVN